MKKISDRIFYVGVNDDDKVLFEGLWPLPVGVSYNSYIVKDEKVALIDTVEGGFEDEYIAHIKDKRCPAGACARLNYKNIIDNFVIMGYNQSVFPCGSLQTVRISCG